VRFLSDESCDFTVVRALRAAGHDVTVVADISPRADDEAIVALAAREQRILLTEDKDFGQLVYAASVKTGGVVLLRFRTGDRPEVARTLLDFVDRHGASLPGRFAVVSRGRVRIGP